jgi:hypothetical protein
MSEVTTPPAKRRAWRRRMAMVATALAAIVAGGLFAVLPIGRHDPAPLVAGSSPDAVAATPSPTHSASPMAAVTPSPAQATPETTAEPTMPTPSVVPGVTPSPLPVAVPAHAHNSILHVEVDGLAVRRAPLLMSPLATAWQWLRDRGWEELGDARLNTGDYVTVELGPLVIGDAVWYRVWPAEDATFNYSTVVWDTRGDGANPVEPGWVAASVGRVEYLSLYQEGTAEWRPGVAAAGSGNYLSEPTETHDLLGLDWALAENETGSPCTFRLSLEALDGGATFLALETSLVGAFEEGHEILGTGNRIPVIGEWGDLARVTITSDCRWAFVLEAWGHD